MNTYTIVLKDSAKLTFEADGVNVTNTGMLVFHDRPAITTFDAPQAVPGQVVVTPVAAFPAGEWRYWVQGDLNKK